ncbi:MAG TPA: glycosyltransferase family 4 protein [Candidatus Paceibacterota bacterium]|nr:glycosyltransferase family 4 protein [Candidatus Paceibacterota bacterium]
MRRILIFSLTYYPNHIGGAEVAIKEITDRIGSDKYTFDMVTLRTSHNLAKVERIGKVNIYRVGFGVGRINRILFPLFALHRANRLYNKRPYDAVWSMMANYAGIAAILFKLTHVSVPFLLTLQEGDPIDHIKSRTRPVWPLFKLIFLRANFVQTISNYLADFAKSMGYTEPLAVVPNGVDVALFSKPIMPPEMFAVEDEIGKKSGDVFLVTASRLVKKNATADTIRSLQFLPANVKLLICGTGSDERMLYRLTQKLDLSSRVIFKGFVDHKDLPLYLKACDIFIRPSLSEGFGNSFIEAMAAHIPVIATPVGGIVDFLRDKETGLFCGINDPKDIALKVGIYMRDANLHDEIITNAFDMVSKKYDWSLIADQMQKNVFERML